MINEKNYNLGSITWAIPEKEARLFHDDYLGFSIEFCSHAKLYSWVLFDNESNCIRKTKNGNRVINYKTPNAAKRALLLYLGYERKEISKSLKENKGYLNKDKFPGAN